MPNRWAFLGLFVAWIALFHFCGSSTLGYVNTSSLFGWWYWVYTRGAEAPDGSIDLIKLLNHDEAYAWFIPLVILFLLWSRRDQLLLLPTNPSWAALGILAAGALIHVLGFMVQQSRLSVVGFSVGLFGLTGLVWGWPWLKATLFPFALLGFCVPIGSMGEAVTFPLRQIATQITALVCHLALGINVIQNGTQLLDPGGAYQYEVAAACSGIRSLTAIIAFALIYGYLNFNVVWRRLAILASAFPLAVVANVFRLCLIVLAAEAFGQKAGDYVHHSSWLSLAPYVPSLGGVLALGWWLREDRKGGSPPPPIALERAEQKS